MGEILLHPVFFQALEVHGLPVIPGARFIVEIEAEALVQEKPGGVGEEDGRAGDGGRRADGHIR